jgi:hypothetical protein
MWNSEMGSRLENFGVTSASVIFKVIGSDKLTGRVWFHRWWKD